MSIRVLLLASFVVLSGCKWFGKDPDPPVGQEPPPPPAVTAPGITTQPGPVNASTGQTATFSVTASGTAPITYQWRRDGIDIVDRVTGECRKTHLFCAVLPFSSYTFGEFAWTQNLASFIESHERMWAFFGFTLSSVTAAFRVPRPDIVIASSPPLVTAIPGWIVARLRRPTVPYIFEIRDLWPESAVSTGVILSTSIETWWKPSPCLAKKRSRKPGPAPTFGAMSSTL